MNKETIEEAAERLFSKEKYPTEFKTLRKAFISNAKWQQDKNKYSEEEVKSAFRTGFSIGYGSDIYAIDVKDKICEEWFEQFKKK